MKTILKLFRSSSIAVLKKFWIKMIIKLSRTLAGGKPIINDKQEIDQISTGSTSWPVKVGLVG